MFKVLFSAGNPGAKRSGIRWIIVKTCARRSVAERVAQLWRVDFPDALVTVSR